MNKDRNYILSLIFDGVIVLLTLFGAISGQLGICFIVNVPRLTETPYFYTFTALSNLFLGLVALFSLIIKLIKKENVSPSWLFVLKICSLSSVIITFLVTLLYLSPSVGSEAWRLYVNSNLLNHLINPALGFLAFFLFEKKANLKYHVCFFSLIPMLIYGIMYLARAIPHIDENGKVNLYYDIYGLMKFGVGITILFLIGFIIIDFFIAFGLYKLNQRKSNN